MFTTIGQKLDVTLRIVGSSLVGASVSLLLVIASMRQLLGTSYDYLSDFTVWLMIWSFMLLLGPVYRDGEHVSIGAIFQKLPRKPRLAIALLNGASTLAFAVMLTVGGAVLMDFLISLDQVYARVIRVPMWIAQICVPIGGFCLAIYAVRELIQIVTEFHSSAKADIASDGVQQ